jgi:hypothetical protein
VIGRCLDAALQAESACISVLPPKQDGSKAPDSPTWKKYQTRRASKEDIQHWYAAERTGVGWVCGVVSGGLEVIDFDDRSALAEFGRLATEAGLGDLLNRIQQGYFEHSPNGAHIAYRCSAIGNNTRLAKRGAKTLIETRGEGGYIIVAPTYGSVNSSGSYELISGSIETIATILPNERRALHDLARMLDESIQPSDDRRAATRKDRPGDDYNERAGWSDILTPHGWVQVSQRLGVTSWRRPDKKTGISATTNHADSDLLYVFSTNTVFDSERGYSKFSVYTILNHGGDHSSASKTLALLGYGRHVQAPQVEVDLSGILGERKVVEKTPLPELLRVPGFIGDLSQWMVDSAVKPQPMLALGAAIAAASTILGRRVMTETGLRTNLYILGVGHTGCGKERARQAISSVFADSGAEYMLGDSFASDSAVEVALGANPACLYMIDEIGHFLGIQGDKHAPAYIKAIIPIFLRVYSCSEGIYRKKTYADSDRNKDPIIEQPCLSIYGTTVPGNLYDSIQREQMSNGLLSRFLVFRSDDPDPHVRHPDPSTRETPSVIRSWCERWLARAGEGGDLRPEPVEVKTTQRARTVVSDLEADARSIRTARRRAGRDQGPYTRMRATALKLALVRACGISDTPEITESDARWACDLTWSLTTTFVDQVESNLAENKTESDSRRVEKIVREAGGMSRSELANATRWLQKRQREDTVSTLVESGHLTVSEERRGTRGPMTTVYRCRTYKS